MEPAVLVEISNLAQVAEEIKSLKGNNYDLYIAVVATVITALLGVISYRQQEIAKKQFDILTKTNELANKQQRISMIENNLDVLQRLNETALSSEENLEAAFTSVNKSDEATGAYNARAARQVFFHYLRINRMYRAWLLKKNDLMTIEEYNLIVKNYAGTLKRALPQMTLLSKRGYDNEFIEEIIKIVDESEVAPQIILKGDSV